MLLRGRQLCALLRSCAFSSIPFQLALAPMRLLALGVERWVVVPVQSPHDANPGEHRWAAALGDEDQGLYRGLPAWQILRWSTTTEIGAWAGERRAHDPPALAAKLVKRGARRFTLARQCLNRLADAGGSRTKLCTALPSCILALHVCWVP